MKSWFYDALCENPIISAIKNSNGLNDALESPAEIIFLLGGNICELNKIITSVREKNKKLLIHIDLIEGIGKDYYALRYLKNNEKPDGIITTKVNLVKYALELDIFVIQRLFMLDSMSLLTCINSLKTIHPDAIEIMPGILSKIIKIMKHKVNVPIIAGGLINDKDDVVEALKSGALGVSTSNKSLWYM